MDFGGEPVAIDRRNSVALANPKDATHGCDQESY